ncbi:MAG: PEGA domain-containing protein, partial [Verrucomicrobia bacterium]|nr:PEGA domain-containing protein [Verrucomicrobiota bacterium]
FTGCATIINGPDQKVTILSEPPGAHIAINGVEAGYTPATFKIIRAKDHVVTLSMEGYHTHDEELIRQLSGVTAFYILPGGLASMAVDSAQGTLWCFEDEVKVELKELFDPDTIIAKQMKLLKQLDVKNEC